MRQVFNLDMILLHCCKRIKIQPKRTGKGMPVGTVSVGIFSGLHSTHALQIPSKEGTCKGLCVKHHVLSGFSRISDYRSVKPEQL